MISPTSSTPSERPSSSTTRTATQELGQPGRSQPLLPARMPAIGMHLAAEMGDGHRTLALAVDLHQLVAQKIEGVLEVADIHRRAAIGDQPQRLGLELPHAAVLDQALQHGGRQEDAAVGPAIHELDGLRHLILAALGRDLHRAARQQGEVPQARAVADRGGMHDRTAGRRPVDIGEVVERHRQEIAMREHGALGPAGGARRVEEPRQIGGLRFRQGDGIAHFHEGVGPCRDVDDLLEPGRLLGRLGDGRGEIGRHEAEPGAGILQDEGELPGVQLGVHRHGAEAGMPDRVHHLDRLDAVRHGEGHAIAAHQTEAAREVHAHHRNLAPQVAIGEMGRGRRGRAPADRGIPGPIPAADGRCSWRPRLLQAAGRPCNVPAMQDFDFAIVGAGIAGVSAAYHLAPHARVIVLEREHVAGLSHDRPLGGTALGDLRQRGNPRHHRVVGPLL